MPRRKRITLRGYVYHVLNRANGRLKIFKKQGDFEAFGYIAWTDPTTWPLYVTIVNNRMALMPQGCVDCRVLGGTLSKPDFWID